EISVGGATASEVSTAAAWRAPHSSRTTGATAPRGSVLNSVWNIGASGALAATVVSAEGNAAIRSAKLADASGATAATFVAARGNKLAALVSGHASAARMKRAAPEAPRKCAM